MLIESCHECPYGWCIIYSEEKKKKKSMYFSVPDNCPERGHKIEWPEKKYITLLGSVRLKE